MPSVTFKERFRLVQTETRICSDGLKVQLLDLKVLTGPTGFCSSVWNVWFRPSCRTFKHVSKERKRNRSEQTGSAAARLRCAASSGPRTFRQEPDWTPTGPGPLRLPVDQNTFFTALFKICRNVLQWTKQSAQNLKGPVQAFRTTDRSWIWTEGETSEL